MFSENADAQESDMLSTVTRTNTPPRPSPGTLDPSRHMILPYTEEDVVPFTEELLTQYDAPILRARSEGMPRGRASAPDDGMLPLNRSAPIRGDDRYGAQPSRGVRSSATFDDDDVSVDTAMASHFGT